jgi:hypothetical protein
MDRLRRLILGREWEDKQKRHERDRAKWEAEVAEALSHADLKNCCPNDDATVEREGEDPAEAPADRKPADRTSADSTSDDRKPADSTSDDRKPADSTSDDSTSGDRKSADRKPADSTSDDAPPDPAPPQGE